MAFKVTFIFYNSATTYSWSSAIQALSAYIKKHIHALRGEIGVSENGLVRGNLGSMSLRKGQEFFLQAFSLVKEEIPNTKLILVGSENRIVKERLFNLAAALNISDSVLFLGRQENCVDFYGVMDTFVLSST